MTNSRTKIFGMELTIDPKVIVLALLIIAGLVYYFTSSSDSGPSSSSPAAVAQPSLATTRPALNPAARSAASRRANASRGDRDTLKLVAVDGSRGDVDPTLHLRLLERVKSVPPAAGLRNLFEAGGAVLAADMVKVPAHPPKIPIKPIETQVATTQPPAAPAAPQFVIPLKYYGFARSTARAIDGNRGLFMDGDNILIGAEGDLLEKRFLIVALTPNMARLEDTQSRQGQDLQVTPEATAQ